MLNNLICASNGVMIFCFIFDAILILAAVGLFLWYYLKTSKNKQNNNSSKTDGNVEKINDDTYVIASEEFQPAPVEEEPVQKDNAIEHFVNQISDINEAVNNELTSNAVVVSHEVEQPVKKVPKKDEIQNYVMVGGIKKEKTEDERLATHNRGSNAFSNSTNFLNLIKEEQKEFSSPETASKKAESTATKSTTTKKTTK